MKNLRLILTAGAVTISLLSLEASAAPISPEKAISKVSEFYSSHSRISRMAPSKDVSFEIVQTVKKNGRNCFYIINHKNGFTIVSADDRLPEVLGFSNQGSFNPDSVPVNMQWWLEEYEKDIDAYLSKNPQPEVQYATRASNDERKAISPMLKTKWDQGSPYNFMCPYDNRLGGVCVTGCVATAMAQVMRYHEWPKKSTGSKGDVVFNTKYDWDNMLNVYEDDKYTDTQSNAVAELMRDCGLSVDMQYSAYESGAYNEQVQVALREYFDYNPSMEFAWRDYHDMKEWNEIVYSELAENRPVYYSGSSSRGGHAFVCDGYLAADFFHFNWGWGGYQDGYFLLNALNPSSGGAGSYEGGYNIGQSVLLGVKPSNGEKELQMTLNTLGGFTYNESNKNFTPAGDPQGYNMFYNPLFYTVTGTLGIKVTNEADPSDVHYFRSSQRVTLESRYGIGGFSCSASGLANGTYRVTPAFYNEYNKWNDIGVDRSMQYYVTLKVDNNNYTYSNDGVKEAKLICGLPQSSPVIYGDALQAFSVMVSNVSDVDFNGILTLYYRNTSDTGSSLSSTDKTVTIAANSSLNVEFITENIVEPGIYSGYIFKNYSENSIIDAFSIEIDKFGFSQPAKDEKIKISNISPNFFNNSEKNIAISFMIENKSMEQIPQSMVVCLYPQGTLEPVLELTTQAYQIPGNATATLRIPEINVNLKPGVYYWQVFTPENRPLSAPTELIVTAGPYNFNGTYYYVTSEEDKTAVIVSPPYRNYIGGTFFPDQVNGYDVAGVRADALTFADKVNHVVLPSTIKVVEPATFYCADELTAVTFSSAVPPVIYTDAFNPDAMSEIALCCPHGSGNVYAHETGYENFKLSSWDITIDAEDLTLLTSLDIDPLTNLPYSPYYISGDEHLTLDFEAPESRAIQYEIEMDGETSTLYTWRSVWLPALWGKHASVKITSTEGSGVKKPEASAEPADIFSIDGYIVKYKATEDDYDSLPAGIYIHRGKKVIIR